MNRYNVKRLLVALAITPLAGGAHAGGPAFSGLFASADSAETVYNNPAGMTRLDGRHLTNQVIFIVPMSEFEVDEDLTTTEGGNPRKPDSAFVPAVYYQDEFADDWRWGVSLNVPSGFGSNNGPNWAGRYYSDEFTLAYVALSPALAYKVTENLSVGAGLSIVYTSSETSTRVNNENFQAGAPDGRLETESDGVGIGWSVSALYEFSESTRIGFAYRSESDADLDSKLDFNNVIRPPEIIESLEGQTINIADTVPMVLGGGIYHRLQNDWVLTADLMWMEFSEFGVTEITINDTDLNAPDDLYDDFFAGSLGLNQRTHAWACRPGLHRTTRVR